MAPELFGLACDLGLLAFFGAAILGCIWEF